MAYRCGDGYQMMILSRSIEDYVAKHDLVQAYDAFAKMGNLEEGSVRKMCKEAGAIKQEVDNDVSFNQKK
jgi:hypothetical protein